MDRRRGGVLLHPTSLPSLFGIGDLGSGAQRWLDWLGRSGLRLWQILPLVPIGSGNSPYSGTSAFAGNPLLISLEALAEEGLLSPDEISHAPNFRQDRVEYARVSEFKMPLLDRAADRLRAEAGDHLQERFRQFRARCAHWLDDYALFSALKEAHGGRSWIEWEQGLRDRHADSLRGARKSLHWRVESHMASQFFFFRQWERIRRSANQAGIAIVGDLPIFVAHDSADVWVHRELFQLDDHGQPTAVAGVPPDYFAPTGQRWGNPLFRWDVLQERDFDWWIERVKTTLATVDYVRLDHFRGFEAYWEIPAQAPTAETGQWVKAPGAEFLSALRQALGSLPFIAEDLGVITPAVESLREDFELPGMRILQFGLEGGLEDGFLPHNYVSNCVAYTGTHDNDTSRGWYESAGEDVRTFAQSYLDDSAGEDIHWQMIAAIWSSIARWAVAPLQDFLGLGSQARMNFPGTVDGNWEWRCAPDQLTDDLAARIRQYNHSFDR